MADTLYPTAELSALYIQKGYGAHPEFRGYLSVTGDLTKNDGDYTPVWAYLAGQAVKIAEQRGTPDDVTVSIDGPLQAIADLAGKQQDCPIDLLVVIDKCLTAAQKMQWGRWGSTAPEMIVVMPEAKITQRGISNLLSREGQQPMVLGNFQARFPDWIIINGKGAMRSQAIVSGTTVVDIATTTCSGCGDSMCGGIAGCSEWYASAADGTAKKSVDGGSTWDALVIASKWTTGGAVYADPLVVLIGGTAGVGAPYGVQRSTDGGATFAKVTFGTAAGGSTHNVNDILHYQNDLFALADDGIWRSTNDGATWTRVVAAAGMKHGAFGDGGFGVAVATAGLYITNDGGLNWTAVSSSAGPKDVAIAGGYVHMVSASGGDIAGGYARIGINHLKAGALTRIEQKDTVANQTRIAFCNRMIGYRIVNGALQRTINGGYSWDAVASAVTWTELANCGALVATAGSTSVGFFNPGFDTPIVAGGGGSSCGC